LKVQIHTNPTPLELTFSLIGLDAAIANAFRRILIADIPTLAIEFVYVHNNTSIVQDEVLCHRLGLVPLKGAKEGLRWMTWFQKAAEDGPDAGDPTDYNTAVLKLKIECTRNEDAAEGETDPTKLYHNAHVYARDFTFHPAGRQNELFKGDGALQAVHPDILLAKMRHGQVIDMEMHCIKGIGADHAKFSPVATASYRLLPTIEIVKPILGKDAYKFARCFPKGVIGFEPVTKREAKQKGSGYEVYEGKMKAVVQDPMRDTVSRECLRHEEFSGKVKLGRVRDHFIFSIESTGQFDGDELFIESVKLLALKCRVMKRSLAKLVL
jgi:DNA-directed RNA polymerase I and III subunit RPAC1